MEKNKEIKDINFNSSECLKSYDLLGTTEYVNLCNNEINTVPWGVEGWLMFVITIIMILLLGMNKIYSQLEIKEHI